jgi:hypothetical protein
MVSLKQRQDLASLSKADPDLKRIQLLFNGESISAAGSKSDGVRGELLSAIALNDPVRFKENATRIGQRKVSVESDWCQDDYLMFLLLLGNQKFGRPLTFLSNIIEVRRQNPNPIPQKINEAFAALDRGEFGIDGEFGFLKIPFLHLSGKLRLGPAEARKAIDAMSAPGLLEQMSPLLKLLTQKAYDLVLIERQPIPTETTAQLIEAFEAHAKNFSLRDWRRVVGALPGRLILAIISAVCGLGLIPLLFGVGKGLIDSHGTQTPRKRPVVIEVAAAHEPASDLAPELNSLVKAMLLSTLPSTNKVIAIEVKSAPFVAATPSFVVEASHPEKSVKTAVAFTEAVAEGVRPFTVVPLQQDGGRVRAILPESGMGQRICFILLFEAAADEKAQSVAKRIVLRSLQ